MKGTGEVGVGHSTHKDRENFALTQSHSTVYRTVEMNPSHISWVGLCVAVLDTNGNALQHV